MCAENFGGKAFWAVFSMLFGFSAAQAVGPSLRMLSPGQTFSTGDRTITLVIGEEAYDEWTPFLGSYTLEYDWADWFGWGDTFGAATATCYSPPASSIFSSVIHTHTARLKFAYGASVSVSTTSGGMMPYNSSKVHGPFNEAHIYAETHLDLEADRNAWSVYRAVRYNGQTGWDDVPIIFADGQVKGYTSNADPAANDFFVFEVGLEGPPTVSPVHRLVIQASDYQSLYDHSLGGLQMTGTNDYAVTFNGQPLFLDEGQTSVIVQEGDLIGVKARAESMLTHNGPMMLDRAYSSSLPQFLRIGSILTTCQVSLWYASGLTQEFPLIPDGPKTPGQPLSFDGLTIGAEGLGLNSPIWFDPPVIAGYEFSISGNTVSGIQFPASIKDIDGVVIRYFDGSDWHSERVWENEWMDYYAFGAPTSWFVVEDLQIAFESWQNPDNFVMAWGLVFTDTAQTDVTITPLAGTVVVGCSDADLTGDGHVGLADLLDMAGVWLDTGLSIHGDINGDGVVNTYDLAELGRWWLQTCE